MKPGQRILLSLLTVVSCVLSRPQESLAASGSAVATAISARELAQQVAGREDRVPEFKFIRETAQKLGVRVWLFGGTAAGYLHYVKWDLQRERGDLRFLADRFDYDYTNIYRSTQDLDIVADGPKEKLEQLQLALQAKYPQFLGSKTRWEVRSLREASGEPGTAGYKEALLNDFDFLNQDTDSNSTGMIELTRQGQEPVVRDLRDWGNAGFNHFLKDSAEDKNTYYRSRRHFETARAKAGQNPEIFSVIRALTKAFQYELSFSNEDWQEMQQVIDDFDPAALSKSNETRRRLKDIGAKLFKNAVNIEYAWNVLEKTGLRHKLMSFDDPTEKDSLAWLMNKEPLRTFQVGTGKGQTARELGLDLVAHETSSFLAYESLTRAHTGDLNAFISRDGFAGEAATFGPGFYAQVGVQGARDTGFTIRAHLDPRARLGTDFTLHLNGQYVVIHNKAAVKVIPESLNMTPLEFFEFLSNQKKFDKNDRGIYEKLKRRLNREIHNIKAGDLKKILKIVQKAVKTNPDDPVLEAWFSLPISAGYPDFLRQLMAQAPAGHSDEAFIVEKAFQYPHWVNPELLNEYADHYQKAQSVIIHVLAVNEEWGKHPEIMKRYLARQDLVTFPALQQPFWVQPELVKPFIQSGNDHTIEQIWMAFSSQPLWAKHPELVEMIMRKGRYDSLIIRWVLSHDFWLHPQWIESYLKKGIYDQQLVTYVMTQPFALEHPEWIQTLIDHGLADKELVSYVLNRDGWEKHPEFLLQLIKEGDVDQEIVERILSRQNKERPRGVVEALIQKGTVDNALINYLFWNPETDAENIRALLRHGKENPNIYYNVLYNVLAVPGWERHPDLLQMIIRKGNVPKQIVENLLNTPHWQKNKDLQMKTKGRALRCEGVFL